MSVIKDLDFVWDLENELAELRQKNDDLIRKNIELEMRNKKLQEKVDQWKDSYRKLLSDHSDARDRLSRQEEGW